MVRTKWWLTAIGCLAAALVASCGSDLGSTNNAQTIPVIISNQFPMPAPCTGTSLTFFQGTTPVDIPNQGQQTVQVEYLFNSAYQIGFQINGWYWRSCTSPGVCPNPNGCRNPDNAGQVGVQIGSNCSSASLIPNFNLGTCDSMVPNATGYVAVTLTNSNPCTVTISPTASMLQPTDQCCSCSTCSGSQVPQGQTTHCN